jgi:hypothetical protein
LNCFSNGLASQVAPVDQSNGFDITTTYPEATTTVLDFTFTSGIVTFPGYDESDPLSPTVEFCVKVTLDDAHYRELAVNYTIDLDGNFDLIAAVDVDALMNPGAHQHTMAYTVDA